MNLSTHSDKTKARSARKQRAFESRREREFYSYYQAVHSLSNLPPSLCDLNDPESVAAHRPASSPDKTLTAFAQLVALRLRTRRAMLFFFDEDHAYVLAEATRTLSLLDDSRHDAEDALWLGATKLPRGVSVCEHTVNLPANAGSNAADPASNTIVHVVNDLREDTRFCDRPFVTGGPMARFYAGVPITTPKGINIGVFCVLDDQTREGLNDGEILFLRDMASTTMIHLEMVRAKVENQRSREMTVGLGAFMKRKSSLQDRHSRSARRRSTSTRQAGPADGAMEPDPSVGSRSSPLTNMGKLSDRAPTSSYRSQSPPVASPNPTDVKGDNSAGTPVPTTDIRPEQDVQNTNTIDQHSTDDVLSNNVHDVFTRSASLLRQALDVHGVVFLDASARTIGASTDGFQGPPGSTDTSTDVYSASDRDSLPRVTGHAERRPEATPMATDSEPLCAVLAAAYPPRPNDEGKTSHARFTVSFLKALLRRYPQGKIWNFNQDGNASSDEYSDDYSDDPTKTSESQDSSHDDDTSVSSRRTRKRIWTRVRDGRMIQKMFPGARSLGLVGLWDSHQEGWFASSVIWSYSPIRVLTTEGELNYLAAFCDVTLAEVWRIQAQLANRSKNDFLSTISHELRSPLHGILGSAEYLQDEELDPSNQEMIRTIVSCGTTLLDIINNLLEHSRINDISPNMYTAGLPVSRSNRDKLRPKSSRGLVNGSGPPNVDVSLDTLTEDVVETAFASYMYRRGGSHDKQLLHFRDDDYDATLSDGNVILMLNIDRDERTNWKFSLPPGTWQRICINLVSNALKYTQSGFIRVDLSQTPLQQSSTNEFGNADVVLTVTDTGVGMSQTFQNQSLFKPFRQEDNLKEGTGLGLSLVADIVKSQRGTVLVKSSKGAGSSLKVTLPLRFTSPSLPPDAPTMVGPSCQPFSGVVVGFVGFALYEKFQKSRDPVWEARHTLLNIISSTCAHLGMQTYIVRDEVRKDAQIHFILELEARKLTSGLMKATTTPSWSGADLMDRPLIALCYNRSTAFEFKSSLANMGRGGNIHHLSQPFGPVKLQEAITACLESSTHHSGDLSTKMSVPDGLPTFNAATQLAVNSRKAVVEIPTRAQLHSRNRDEQSNPGDAVPAGSENLAPSRSNALLNAAPRNDMPRKEPGLERSSQLHSAAANASAHIAVNVPVLNPRHDVRSESLVQTETSARVVSKTLEHEPKAFTGYPTRIPSSGAPETSSRSTPSQRDKCSSLLLVDDNAINLQLLTVYAKKSKHRYVTAENGVQAVEAYQRALDTPAPESPKDVGASHGTVDNPISDHPGTPDVILMDINMPIMDGYEATHRIRRLEQKARTKPATIVALTGLGSADAQQKAFASGMDLFLTKPIRLKDLTLLLDGVRDGTGSPAK